MAIQRMYTGKGGAVQFDKPAITPTEISQQHGRSMTDILKFKQTMGQRRKENLLELTDYEYNKKLLSTDRDKMLKILGGAKEQQAAIMAEAGEYFDLPVEKIVEMKQVREAAEMEMGGIEEHRGKITTALLNLQEDQASGKGLIYDQEASMEAIKAAEKSGKIPPGGLLKTTPVNIKELMFQASKKVRKVPTGAYDSRDVGDSIILIEGEAYSKKDIETQAEILSGKSRAQKSLFEEYGDVAGIAGGIEEMLPTLYGKKIGAHKKKEEAELGTIRAVPGASVSANIKIMPGGEETKQVMGKEGKVRNYDVTYVNEVQGFKGEVTLSPGGILKTTDVKMLDIKAGEVLGEKRFPRGDEIRGENLVGYSFKTVQVPAVVGYKVLTGEDIIIYKKNWLGTKDIKDYTIKAGSQVDRKQLAAMSEEQRKRVVTKPFVDVVVHSAAYKNFTVSEPLTKAWKRKLSLSDAAYDNYQKGYSAEGIIEEEEGTELRANGTKKDIGYFGELQLPDGRSATEYSVGVNFNGKETEIPSLVPTLTKKELNLMVNDIIPNDKKVPQAILSKAISHAKKRIGEGKSPFYRKGEEVPDSSGHKSFY